MKRLAVCALLALLALPAAGVEPYPVKDINPVLGPDGSDPSFPTAFGGAVLFFADDGVSGRRLWRSDGTAAGTFRLGDTALPGPMPFLATERLYFFLSDHPLRIPTSLWVSDGTAAGTFRLTDAGVSIVPWLPAWSASQGVLYFVARDPEHGVELWRTDGTPAGTHLVADVRPGPEGSNAQEPVELGGRIWFGADDGQRGGALWRTDGTTAGTVLAVDPVPSSASHGNPEHLRVVGKRLAFFAAPPGRGRSRQLWAGDGTVKGTKPVTSLGNASLVEQRPVVHGNRLFFVVRERKNQSLWVSDGTGRGTRALVRFQVFFFFELSAQEGTRGLFVFQGFDAVHGGEPWVTDGTPQGTRLLRDLCPGACSSFPFVEKTFAGRLYFSAQRDFAGRELFSTDGTAQGTRQVSSFCARDCGSSLYAFFVVGSRLLFVANDGETGWQIWSTDGSAQGTGRVTDFASRSLWEEDGFHGAVLNGQLLFGADDSAHGNELWRTDGTAVGTGLVADVNRIDAGGSFPTSLRPLGDEVVFAIRSLGEPELWRSDGTAAGTVRIRSFAADESGGARPVDAFVEAGADEGGSRLFYFGYELGDRYVPWRTDGTAAGTFPLGAGGPVCCVKQEMEAVGSTVFFNFPDEEHGRELWASDGTREGTRLVLDILPGADDSSPQELTAFQGKVWFSADGPGAGTELWTSDGTAAGTVPVKDVNPGADGSRPRHLTVHAGRLWFFAEDGEHGRELWSSDGTGAGTRLEVELLPGPASYESLFMTALGDRLVFSLHGNGLWVTDGTPAGTRKIHERPIDEPAEVWTVFQGRLHYVALGTLWSTDGTEAGTGQLLDRDGKTIFSPGRFAVLGGRLVFTAQDLFGTALFESDGTPEGTFTVEPRVELASPVELVGAGERAFYPGYDFATGWELWAVRP